MINTKMEENGTHKKGRLSTKLRKRAFLAALRKSLGIITTAMEAAGVKSPQTIANWRESDKAFNAEFEECEMRAGDFVETKLFQQINKGDTSAIIFYCKTKLKNRGYTERTEITGAEGKDLLAGKTDEELNATIAELKRKLDT